MTTETCAGGICVLMLLGHVIVGGVESTTVTVAVQVFVPPWLSETVSVTLVEPRANGPVELVTDDGGIDVERHARKLGQPPDSRKRSQRGRRYASRSTFSMTRSGWASAVNPARR